MFFRNTEARLFAMWIRAENSHSPAGFEELSNVGNGGVFYKFPNIEKIDIQHKIFD
jgi:hypothetical protein